MRDSQRERAYQWENTHFDYRQRPLVGPFAATDLAHRMGLAAGQKVTGFQTGAKPEVRLTRRHNARALGSGTGGIVLPPWAMVDVVIAHEVAHWIDDLEERHHNLPRRAGHGPDWMGWFCALLVAFCRMSADHLARSATAAGLKITPKCSAMTAALARLDEPERIAA